MLDKMKNKIMKNKITNILGLMLVTLLLLPCDFFPFAYLETENDMTKIPLCVWCTIKLLMFFNSIV